MLYSPGHHIFDLNVGPWGYVVLLYAPSKMLIVPRGYSPTLAASGARGLAGAIRTAPQDAAYILVLLLGAMLAVCC